MDLDTTLARLGATPVPDLSAIDGAALAKQAHSQARQMRGAIGAAMIAALGIGVISGTDVRAPAESPLVAFGPPASLTPLIALGQE